MSFTRTATGRGRSPAFQARRPSRERTFFVRVVFLSRIIPSPRRPLVAQLNLACVPPGQGEGKEHRRLVSVRIGYSGCLFYVQACLGGTRNSSLFAFCMRLLLSQRHLLVSDPSSAMTVKFAWRRHWLYGWDAYVRNATDCQLSERDGHKRIIPHQSERLLLAFRCYCRQQDVRGAFHERS